MIILQGGSTDATNNNHANSNRNSESNTNDNVEDIQNDIVVLSNAFHAAQVRLLLHF